MSDEVKRLLGNGETVRVHRERASGGYIDDVPIEKILAAVDREIAKGKLVLLEQVISGKLWLCHPAAETIHAPESVAYGCYHYGGTDPCLRAERERLEREALRVAAADSCQVSLDRDCGRCGPCVARAAREGE